MGWALQDARSVWGMGGGGESNGIREEGWGEPHSSHCPPDVGGGQEGVGVEDRVVGDVVSAEVEEPCQG